MKQVRLYWGEAVVSNALLTQPPRALLRLATVQDIPRLVSVEKGAFDKARYDGLNTPRTLRHLIVWGNSLLIVAEVAGVVMGYAQLNLHQRHQQARLYSLAVAPEAQGGGLGRALVTACEDLCRALRLPRLSLEYRADNTAMRPFYAARGYRITRSMPNYYPDGMDGERVVKRLLPD